MARETPRRSAWRYLGHSFEAGALGLGLYLLLTSLAAIHRGMGRELVWWLPAVARIAVITVATYAVTLVPVWVRGRAHVGVAARVRLFFVTQVCAWATLVFSTATFHIVRVHMVIGIAVGVYSGLSLARAAIGDRVSLRVFRFAELAAVHLCLVLLGLELGLRAIGAVSGKPVFARLDEHAVDRLQRFAYAPGFVRYGFPVNEGSHYDAAFEPKHAGHPRVLTIGDSFSAGVVPHHYHFTTVAERELGGLEICNMGIPSTGPLEYLHLLQNEGLALEPDVIVINVFVGNDHRRLRAPHGAPRRQRHPPFLVPPIQRLALSRPDADVPHHHGETAPGAVGGWGHFDHRRADR